LDLSLLTPGWSSIPREDSCSSMLAWPLLICFFCSFRSASRQKACWSDFPSFACVATAASDLQRLSSHLVPACGSSRASPGFSSRLRAQVPPASVFGCRSPASVVYHPGPALPAKFFVFAVILIATGRSRSIFESSDQKTRGFLV
jgi:hypothetical protein